MRHKLRQVLKYSHLLKKKSIKRKERQAWLARAARLLPPPRFTLTLAYYDTVTSFSGDRALLKAYAVDSFGSSLSACFTHTLPLYVGLF